MKNKVTLTARITSLLLAVVISVPVFGVSQTKKVCAVTSNGKNNNNTSFGVSAIKDPVAPSSKDDKWKGDYVYFGKWNQEPVKFRVLDTDTDLFTHDSKEKTLFLDSDVLLYNDYLDYTEGTSWKNSSLRTYMNHKLLDDLFDGYECLAIEYCDSWGFSMTVGTGPEEVYSTTQAMFGSRLGISGEQLFLLDAWELSNKNYGYFPSESAASRIKSLADGVTDTGYYLTRTPERDGKKVGFVNNETGSFVLMSTKKNAGIAPAINIKKSSILFSTWTNQYDSSDPDRTFKLTLLDNDMTISAQKSKGISIDDNGWVTIPYVVSGSDKGIANTASVLILDKEYPDSRANILFYDTLRSSDVFSAEGEGMFQFPKEISGTWGKDYFVYILAEQSHGLKRFTDLASAPCQVFLPDEYTYDFTKSSTLTLDATRVRLIANYLKKSTLLNSDHHGTQYGIDLNNDGDYDLILDTQEKTLRKSNACHLYGPIKVSDQFVNWTFLFESPDVTFDIREDSITMDQVQKDAFDVLLQKNLFGKVVSNHGDYFIDIDGEGTTDIHVSSNMMEKSPGANANAVYYTASQLRGSGFSSIKIILGLQEVTYDLREKPYSRAIDIDDMKILEVLGGNGLVGYSGTETQFRFDLDKDGHMDILYDIETRTMRALSSTNLKGSYKFEQDILSSFGYAYVEYIFPQVMPPDMVLGLKAVSAGKNQVKLTWNSVERAEGYLIYAQKNGSYGYVGMTTKGTTFTDTKALDSDYNFYWVFAYVKDENGNMIPGGCEKYVYAKGVCLAVTNLKASSVTGGVKLTWTASAGADGYLVYGIHPGGSYGYIGMTTKGTTYTDKNASKTDYNFYWVFPYHKDADGNMCVGGTAPYTYGRAK